VGGEGGKRKKGKEKEIGSPHSRTKGKKKKPSNSSAALKGRKNEEKKEVECFYLPSKPERCSKKKRKTGGTPTSPNS